MAKLVCRIELNKETGITVTVENAEGKITQTMIFDGTAIKTTCQGQQATSIITQVQDAITIQCKTFKVEAETIYCLSSTSSKYESTGTFDLASTKDMVFTSKAKLTEKATSDVSIEGSAISCKAENALSAAGMSAEIKATNETKVSGAQLKLSGTAKAEMAAPMIDIKSDGILNAKGSLTTLEGQLTTVKGSLVKIGS